MVAVDIPGFGKLRLEHLVLDFNGTLAVNGVLIPGVLDPLRELADHLQVHVVTADTFGTVAQQLAESGAKVTVLDAGGQRQAKRDYVVRLGPDTVAAVGNGRNDELMLESAAVGLAVIQREGAASAALRSADVVCPSILAALELLTNPIRLTATLRV